MQAAIARSSSGSLHRRFFAVRREFSEKETDYFLDIDFVNHVALVAVANDAGEPTIVGGGRYVVVQPGQAEVAFAIIDAYQGLGIGSALMRHLATLGREAGLREFIAEVLSENRPDAECVRAKRPRDEYRARRDGHARDSPLCVAAEIETPSPPAWWGESPVDGGRLSERTARIAAAPPHHFATREPPGYRTPPDGPAPLPAWRPRGPTDTAPLDEGPPGGSLWPVTKPV